MRALFIAIVIAIAGCTTPEPIEAPDAAEISVVLPCNVQHENCQAARATADAGCERYLRCDSIFGIPFDQCVADAMSALCTSIDCNSGPYERWDELEACNASYVETPCGIDPMPCSL